MNGYSSRFSIFDERLEKPAARARPWKKYAAFLAGTVLPVGLMMHPAHAAVTGNDALECETALSQSGFREGYSKSDAILGKQMSALEAMQAAQEESHNTPAAQKTTCSAVDNDNFVPGREERPPSIFVNQDAINQALVNLRKQSPAIYFDSNGRKPKLASLQQWSILSHPVFSVSNEAKPVRTLASVRRRSIESKPQHRNMRKPDIFGTVALSVSRTPLDRKWNAARVDRKGHRRLASALVAAGGAIGTQNRENNIRAVNKWVNRKVRYAEDLALHGTADHWASAETTLKLGRGDCEDFAIAKMQILQASGIKSSDMFLVIAKDLVRRADHALLVVRFDGQLLVLDNETDQILDAKDVRDYRPIMSYSANQKWLHGYKAKPASRQIASLAVGR